MRARRARARRKLPMRFVGKGTLTPVFGIIFSEATRYNINRGVTSLSNLRVAFHGGGNTKWVTDGYLARTGIRLHGQGYYDNPNDFVPQVLGLRGLSNPGNMGRAIWSFPKLFGPNSPHTNAAQPEH
jgi:hypothetical protein